MVFIFDFAALAQHFPFLLYLRAVTLMHWAAGTPRTYTEQNITWTSATPLYTEDHVIYHKVNSNHEQ
jgi:hypothetical protein